MGKYQNKYRSDSHRLKGFDYGSPGVYFITICTKKRIPHFGQIVDQKILLTKAGKIVAEQWRNTEKIRDNVILGEWVVMPNHFHGIICLKPNPTRRYAFDASLQGIDGNPFYKNRFGPQKDYVSSIIRGFKSAYTRIIRKEIREDFSWQRGFYDHVVRNQRSLDNIEEYIRENPRRWHEDKYYA